MYKEEMIKRYEFKIIYMPFLDEKIHDNDSKVTDVGGYKKPVMSIGTEFMAWAETYWDIENKYNQAKDSQSGESCPYESVKYAFIKQIDEIISQRVKHYM